MPKVRKEIPELEKLVQTGRKKFVRYEEGAKLYSIPKVFIDDENTVAMLNMNQFKGHSGRAFHGIFVSASGAKTTVAAERDKFKISARRA